MMRFLEELLDPRGMARKPGIAKIMTTQSLTRKKHISEFHISWRKEGHRSGRPHRGWQVFFETNHHPDELRVKVDRHHDNIGRLVVPFPPILADDLLRVVAPMLLQLVHDMA